MMYTVLHVYSTHFFCSPISQQLPIFPPGAGAAEEPRPGVGHLAQLRLRPLVLCHSSGGALSMS